MRPLAEIFLLILATVGMPENWRRAIGVPLFKKGCREKLQSYRLVSRTLMVGRLLEGILRGKIYMHLQR